MIPLLFDASERQFKNMGLGPLNDALECTIEKEINGVYQLHMIYPADGLMYSQISTKRLFTPSWMAATFLNLLIFFACLK